MLQKKGIKNFENHGKSDIHSKFIDNLLYQKYTVYVVSCKQH